MKYIAVKEPKDPILYRAVLDKFKALGYEIYKETEARGPGAYPFLGLRALSVYVSGSHDSSCYESIHTIEEFFDLTPEDCAEAPKEMTLAEVCKEFGESKLAELLSSELGYNVKILK